MTKGYYEGSPTGLQQNTLKPEPETKHYDDQEDLRLCSRSSSLATTISARTPAARPQMRRKGPNLVPDNNSRLGYTML